MAILPVHVSPVVSGEYTRLQELVDLLTTENQSLQVDNLELRTGNSSIVNYADIVDRVLANPKVSPMYCRLYIALISLYPQLLEGQPACVQVYDLRARSGWSSKKAAQVFLRALVEIKAISYDSGTYNQTANEREGTIIPNEELFPFPELFDLRSTQDAKKAREAEAERRAQAKAALLIVECRECGSHAISYDLTAKCRDCGHVHEPIKDVDVDVLTVEIESFDVLMDAIEQEGES